ncbi:MAG: LacI family DNA-binding transcriptional regulator [Rhodothermales bacterium]|nr:LacI family DNA-binding transcriptional regulator [Rhodothermales bacterium]MBO6781537.1 LacI family DNA-binding transcriptional regulator [Rhodothermales bacterium]
MPLEKSKVTIYDVAARAKVAISTVSRVLNNSADVSDMTRARVLKAIDELKYRPDRTAKKLAQQRTPTIAVALPTYTTPFHNELLKGVRMGLKEQEVDLLLCDLGWRAPVKTLSGFLRRGTVDGLLLAGVEVDDRVAEELSTLHAPTVIIGSTREGMESFDWDDVAGARAAVEHLVSQGHQRVGMIRSFSDSSIQNDRIQGYREALTSAGLAFQPELVRSGSTRKHEGFSEEAGHEAMQALLALDERPTAVFASSDVQAIGAWSAIVEAGLKVPEDIAVVGYDDLKTSQYLGLSSVDQSIQTIGREATVSLVARMEDELTEDPAQRVLTPRLRVRRSSRFVRT